MRGSKDSIVGNNIEKKMALAYELLHKATLMLGELQSEYHKYMTNAGGDLPPGRDIFYSPIDEDRMADCILKVKEGFFHYDETCMIGERWCNMTDFCLLAFLAFGRMRLLKNFCRKPFCLFLQERAFMGSIPNVKNFNNYANKAEYQELERYLSGAGTNRPKHHQPLLQAYQKIEKAFQNSDYFYQLRVQQSNMKRFDL